MFNESHARWSLHSAFIVLRLFDTTVCAFLISCLCWFCALFISTIALCWGHALSSVSGFIVVEHFCSAGVFFSHLLDLRLFFIDFVLCELRCFFVFVIVDCQ